MSIKLKGSSSGSVSIDAPATTAGGADRTLTLPDKTATMSPRIVLEQFFSPCDGSVITLQDGNHTLTQPAATHLTDSFVDVVGSSIAYTPPAGTQQVVYEYHFMLSDDGGNGPIASFALYLDSDEVTKFRTVIREDDSTEDRWVLKWGFNIGGSADTASGRVTTWTSAKTIKIQGCRYSSSYPGSLHETNHWANGSTDQLSIPCVGITAIG